ncbi:hypothetical protein BZA70DRAFT_291668 [Myxozyma melibiosi]|uniref:AHC1-like C2H2 zinc-finger domain-containing protein n=1 Tax=Myxozyma melibiosi TaxID=54550 RepID=A0ABR1F294_9ASCO
MPIAAAQRQCNVADVLPAQQQQSSSTPSAPMTLAPSPSTLPPAPTPSAKDVIRSQFDLEILLKHRELAVIEDEIAKVHIMMLQLRRCAGKMLANDDPDDFAKHYAQYLLPDRRYSAPADPSAADADRSSSTASSAADAPRSASLLSSRIHLPQYHSTTVGGNPPPTGCIYRRQDGILVRLVCSDCSRVSFGSAQGFINHCRISHSREFSSHDNAAQMCGVELDEEDQDDIGLGAFRHRRHMQLSAGAVSSSPFSAMAAVNNSSSNSRSSVAGKTIPGSVPPSTPAPITEPVLDPSTTCQSRTYDAKSFPWAKASTATAATSTPTASTPASAKDGSDSSFLSHPITPPNEEVGLEQIPRHVPSVDMSAVGVTEKSENNKMTTAAAVQSAPAPQSQPQPQQTATPNASPEIPAPATRHLSRLLKRKQVEIQDLDDMVRESVKRDPRGHLFAGESDASDVDEIEDVLVRKKEEMKLPSVAKFKKMMQESMKDSSQQGNGQQTRDRPVGSGIRILANFN